MSKLSQIRADEQNIYDFLERIKNKDFKDKDLVYSKKKFQIKKGDIYFNDKKITDPYELRTSFFSVLHGYLNLPSKDNQQYHLRPYFDAILKVENINPENIIKVRNGEQENIEESDTEEIEAEPEEVVEQKEEPKEEIKPESRFETEEVKKLTKIYKKLSNLGFDTNEGIEFKDNYDLAINTNGTVADQTDMLTDLIDTFGITNLYDLDTLEDFLNLPKVQENPGVDFSEDFVEYLKGVKELKIKEREEENKPLDMTLSESIRDEKLNRDKKLNDLISILKNKTKLDEETIKIVADRILKEAFNREDAYKILGEYLNNDDSKQVFHGIPFGMKSIDNIDNSKPPSGEPGDLLTNSDILKAKAAEAPIKINRTNIRLERSFSRVIHKFAIKMFFGNTSNYNKDILDRLSTYSHLSKEDINEIGVGIIEAYKGKIYIKEMAENSITELNELIQIQFKLENITSGSSLAQLDSVGDNSSATNRTLGQLEQFAKYLQTPEQPGKFNQADIALATNEVFGSAGAVVSESSLENYASLIDLNGYDIHGKPIVNKRIINAGDRSKIIKPTYNLGDTVPEPNNAKQIDNFLPYGLEQNDLKNDPIYHKYKIPNWATNNDQQPIKFNKPKKNLLKINL